MIVLPDGTELNANLMRIAQEVFATMVNIETKPLTERPELHEPVGSVFTYRASSGKVLTLECDRSLALVLNSRLMTLKAGQAVTEDDIRGSVKELGIKLGNSFGELLASCEPSECTPPCLSLAAMRPSETDKPLTAVWLSTEWGNLRVSLRADRLAGLNLALPSLQYPSIGVSADDRKRILRKLEQIRQDEVTSGQIAC